jgi:hypothetical protein
VRSLELLNCWQITMALRKDQQCLQLLLAAEVLAAPVAQQLDSWMEHPLAPAWLFLLPASSSRMAWKISPASHRDFSMTLSENWQLTEGEQVASEKNLSRLNSLLKILPSSLG